MILTELELSNLFKTADGRILSQSFGVFDLAILILLNHKRMRFNNTLLLKLVLVETFFHQNIILRLNRYGRIYHYLINLDGFILRAIRLLGCLLPLFAIFHKLRLLSKLLPNNSSDRIELLKFGLNSSIEQR